jgi:hypothetical protein
MKSVFDTWRDFVGILANVSCHPQELDATSEDDPSEAHDGGRTCPSASRSVCRFNVGDGYHSDRQRHSQSDPRKATRGNRPYNAPEREVYTGRRRQSRKITDRRVVRTIPFLGATIVR